MRVLGPRQIAGPKAATLSVTMHWACTVVEFSVHHRPPLQVSSTRAAKRLTWVRSSWDFHEEWASLHRRHIQAGAIQAYQITLGYRKMISRPSHHHNRFSLRPNRNVNFCYRNRRRQSVSCCPCNKTRQTACTTVPTDRCRQIIITIIIQQTTITTTPQRQDHLRSEVQMELTSAMWKIKILNVSCAVTKAPANIMDSLRAKVSVKDLTAFKRSPIGA